METFQSLKGIRVNFGCKWQLQSFAEKMFQSLKGIRVNFGCGLLEPLEYAVFKVQLCESILKYHFSSWAVKGVEKNFRSNACFIRVSEFARLVFFWDRAQILARQWFPAKFWGSVFQHLPFRAGEPGCRGPGEQGTRGSVVQSYAPPVTSYIISIKAGFDVTQNDRGVGVLLS